APGRLPRQLDAGHVEMARRFLEKEAVGASEFQQPAAVAVTADEFDAAGELAAQHRLSAEIVGIAVGAAAREIVFGIVGGGVEARGCGGPPAALPALPNVADRA